MLALRNLDFELGVSYYIQSTWFYMATLILTYRQSHRAHFTARSIRSNRSSDAEVALFALGAAQARVALVTFGTGCARWPAKTGYEDELLVTVLFL